MGEWVEKRICNIAEVIAGGTPSTSVADYWDGDISWITPNDLSSHKERFISRGERNISEEGLKKSAAKMLPTNTLLMTTRAPIGYLAISAQEVSTNQGFKNLICDDTQVSYAFLYYYIKLNVEYFKAFATGATFPELSGGTLKRIKVTIPPLPTQTRIAEILSAYDDAIENNNRRISLLERAASELYHEWFVRMRFPGHESAKIVNGLPDGWEIVSLESVVNITSSKRSYESERVDCGIPLYRSKEIIQIYNGEEITDPLFISDEWFAMIRDKFGAPQENDILITSRGTIGVPFLVDKRTFYFSDGNLTWLQSGECPKMALYLYLWIDSPMGQGAILSSTIGTSQKALPIETLKKVKLIKPIDNILTQFSEKIMPCVKQKRNLRKQSQNLVRQRDLLLPRLMSGKMEV